MSSWWQKWKHRSVPDRWCVIDAETSGLNPARDELISLAGVAVQFCEGEVVLQPVDSTEVLLKPLELTQEENILVHGIGRAQQKQALPPAEGLQQFLQWVQDSPLIGFHSPFDQAFIEKTALQYRVELPHTYWLDLADLAPAVCLEPRLRSLDDWLAHFDIEVERRHSAAFDAYATAMLLLALSQAAKKQGNVGFHALRAAARAGRYVM